VPSSADGGRGWVALAAALALAAVLATSLPPDSLEWRPALAWSEPWRALSAAGVHYSGLHLAANLAGAAVVGALGVAAAVSPSMTWAWAAAWPLTQFGLLARPDLLHYAGLSGVLHAGTARRDDGAIVSSGGRVLSVVGTGADLVAARDAAYALTNSIRLPGSHFRSDIGLAAAEGRVSV